MKRQLFLLVGLVFIAWLVLRSFNHQDLAPNPRVDTLIEKLASANQPPKWPGSPPHFHLREFLENPNGWTAEAQTPVSNAYYELKTIGKDAFPYLIAQFEDNRYSHERSHATLVSHTVGDACRFLIAEQIDPRGISYKTRESPSGVIGGHEVLFATYVEENFGTYQTWWHTNKLKNVRDMKRDFCKWRIAKEIRLGFTDNEQKERMESHFERLEELANQQPKKMELPPPDWYTVDAIVMDIKGY